MKKRILSVISVFLSVVLIAPNVSAFGLSSSSETEQSAIAAMGELGALDIEPVESIPVIDETVESQASNEVETESSSESSMPISTEESTGMETSQEELELTTTAETSTGESLTTPSTEVDEEVILEAEPHTDDALVAEYAYLDLKMPGRQACSATTVRPYDVLADVASKSEIIGQVELKIGTSLIFDSSLIKTYYPLAQTISFEQIDTTYFVTYTTTTQDLIILGYYENGTVHKSIDLEDENNLVYIDENGGIIYPDSYFQSKHISAVTEEKINQAMASNDIAALQAIPEISVTQEENFVIIDKTTTQSEASDYSSEINYQQIIDDFYNNEAYKDLAPYTNKVLGSKTSITNGKIIQLTVLETRDRYFFSIDEKADYRPGTPVEIVAKTVVELGLVAVGLVTGSSLLTFALAALDACLILYEATDEGFVLMNKAEFVTKSTCYYNFGRQVFYSTFLNTGTPAFDGPATFLMHEEWEIPDPSFARVVKSEKTEAIYEERFIDGEKISQHVADWKIKTFEWKKYAVPKLEDIPYTVGLDEIAERAAWATDGYLMNHFSWASSEVEKKINDYVKLMGTDLDITGSDVGDTWQTATSIMPEYTYYQNIDRSNDYDYYKFVVPENPGNLKSLYRIETTGDMSKTGTLSNLNANGTKLSLIGGLNNSQTIRNIDRTLVLDPGTYYIQIYRWNEGFVTPVGYSIKVSLLSTDKVSNEWQAGMELTDRLEFEEFINFEGDNDYYKFVVPANNGNLKSLYMIETTGEMNKYVHLYRYNAVNNSTTYIVGHLPASGQNNIHAQQPLEPGTYFLNVGRWNSTIEQPTSYSIKVYFVSQDKVSDTWDKTNVELKENVAFEENIDYISDYDYYKFVVPENPGNLKSLYRIETTGDMSKSILLYRYNSANNSVVGITDFNPVSGQNNINSERIMEPGIYYLRVSRHTGSFEKPTLYSIKVSLISQDKVTNDYKSTDPSAEPVTIPSTSVQYPWFSEAFNYSGDIDCYKFTSYGTDSIRTLMTSGDADTYGTIYKVDYDLLGNPTYKSVRSVDNGGAGKNIKTTIDLPVGNYILLLKTRSPAPISYGIFIDDFGVFD